MCLASEERKIFSAGRLITPRNILFSFLFFFWFFGTLFFGKLETKNFWWFFPSQNSSRANALHTNYFISSNKRKKSSQSLCGTARARHLRISRIPAPPHLYIGLSLIITRTPLDTFHGNNNNNNYRRGRNFENESNRVSLFSGSLQVSSRYHLSRARVLSDVGLLVVT